MTVVIDGINTYVGRYVAVLLGTWFGVDEYVIPFGIDELIESVFQTNILKASMMINMRVLYQDS